MDFFNSTTFQLPTHRLRLRIRSVIWYINVLSIFMYIYVDVVIVYVMCFAGRSMHQYNTTSYHVALWQQSPAPNRAKQTFTRQTGHAMPCHDVKILYARINPLVNCFQRIHSSNEYPTASMTRENKTNRGKAIERIEQCQM